MSDSSESQKSTSVYRCKEIIHDILIQTGQKDQLMCHIRHKTIHHGWLWLMRSEFMEYIKKRGPKNVNVSHMIADLAPVGKRMFPAEVRKELLDCLVDVVKDYFTVDDTIPPLLDKDLENADKTFIFQSHDVKPDPGVGVGVEVPDSPPPSPQSEHSSGSSPTRSPTTTAAAAPTVSTSTAPRQTPAKQSPGPAPKSTPTITVQKIATPQPPPPPPPPPVLRAEPVPTKTEIVKVVEEEEDVRGTNEDEEEDELMDI